MYVFIGKQGIFSLNYPYTPSYLEHWVTTTHVSNFP